MQSFKTCEDEREDMVGLQFTVVDKDDESKIFELQAMGDVSDELNCRVLTIVSGEIERIVASYDDIEEAISGIRYYKGMRFVSFGFIDETEK